MNIKKALVVYNKPLYRLQILENKDPHFQKLLREKNITTKNWKIVNDQHQRSLEGVLRILKLLGIDTDSLSRKELKKIDPYSLVITVGGDGTFLETSHLLENQTILGVNASPIDSTGALCGACLETFLTVLVDLMTGDQKPTKISRLKVKVGKKVLPYPVLNDILFANQSPAGTSRYFIQVGNQQEEQRSSGIWIATGTGSTAAIRSAGGKPLSVDFSGMQFVARELVHPGINKYKLKKGILPKGKNLTLIPKMRSAALYIDGNHIEIPVPYGEKIVVSPNGKPLKVVL